MIHLGLDSFVPTEFDPSPEGRRRDAERVANLLDQIELADRVGLHSFGIGEHHRPDFIASNPATILAAAAARTKDIRLSSAVTVLSSDDPVRVFQQFATVDLISNGRAEIIVGRGSFVESYPLFGHDLADYDELFAESLDLLLNIRENVNVKWSGKHRAPLTGQGVYPRPVQNPLPIRLGVGGTPASFVRAGTLGLPLVVAIIGGEADRFRRFVDMYREAGVRAGHSESKLDVSVHSIGFVADTFEEAVAAFYPGYSAMMGRIGKERGWPPLNQAQFLALTSPRGALKVGDPELIAEKILRESEALGGISGVTIMMDVGQIPHEKMLRAIELLGTRTRPMLS